MRKILVLVSLAFGAIGSANAANRFVEIGIPSPGREWYGSEYSRAAEVFATKTVSVPAFEDPDGRKVIERMVSVENFSLARNLTLPLDQRMEDALTMQGAANSIFKEYIDHANQGKDLHREIAAQIGFSLRLSVVVLDLVDEFLPTIKRDEKYEIRMDGLRGLKMNVETVFSGAEASLGERGYFSEADLSVILTAMADTLPRLNDAFSKDFRVEILRRLQARVPEFPQDPELNALRTMLAELAQSDERGKSE